MTVGGSWFLPYDDLSAHVRTLISGATHALVMNALVRYTVMAQVSASKMNGE